MLCDRPYIVEKPICFFHRNQAVAPTLVNTHSSNREGIGEVLLSQVFDPDTSDILISSWRHGTTSNYIEMSGLHFPRRILFNQLNQLFKPH